MVAAGLIGLVQLRFLHRVASTNPSRLLFQTFSSQVARSPGMKMTRGQKTNKHIVDLETHPRTNWARHERAWRKAGGMIGYPRFEVLSVPHWLKRHSSDRRRSSSKLAPCIPIGFLIVTTAIIHSPPCGDRSSDTVVSGLRIHTHPGCVTVNNVLVVRSVKWHAKLIAAHLYSSFHRTRFQST
jgi:hypothetical protein